MGAENPANPKSPADSVAPLLRCVAHFVAMADVVAKLAAVPLPQLAALGAALVLASFVLFTTVRKLLLPKNAPPTIACMPIIGGILKFIKVGRRRRTGRRLGYKLARLPSGARGDADAGAPPAAAPCRRGPCSSWARATPSTARCSLCPSCTSGSPSSSARRSPRTSSGCALIGIS